MVWLILGFLTVIFTLGTSGQDIKFPDDENSGDVLSGNNATEVTERVPLDIEDRCPENMLLYPGDGAQSVWECDCKPGYLYFPLNNSCHPAYRQGPCRPENYAVLPQGEVVPKCERNPCKQDGLVSYNNTCYELRKIGGPCAQNEYLIVNDATFQLECTSASTDPFMIIDAPPKLCPNGSRRNALGICRKMI
ncbi:uncharacterized protein LOC124186570 [Neodiprion fabricii]|uniref:uncharacterized protein LOC124186570 n=1 Tax=Neodiprion fabricii TaxID=2872261 RepID=UPI001ED92CA0|nr:uncharacterized protein LOC124186570 [Neodiprion fabricii]